MCKWEIGKHYDLFEFQIIRLLPIFFSSKNLYLYSFLWLMTLCHFVIYLTLYIHFFRVSFRKFYGNRNENRSNLLLSEIVFLLFDLNLLVCTVFASICESWQSSFVFFFNLKVFTKLLFYGFSILCYRTLLF